MSKTYFENPSLSRHVFFIIFITSCLFASFSNLYPLDNAIGFTQISGTSRYQIGGFSKNLQGTTVFQFPVSELEFPLHATYLEDTITLSLTDPLKLTLKTGAALSKYSGTMKDSDWLTSTYLLPDIYSESRSRFFSTYVDAHLSYTPPRSPFMTYGLGYSYTLMSWVCSDTSQTYPSDSSAEAKIVKGPTLTYRLSQSVPYLDFSISHIIRSTSAKLTVGMAPYLMLSDNDNHLLRSKRAISNDSGYGHWISAELTTPLTTHWTAGATFSYKTLSAWGKQKQSRYESTTEGPAELISELDHTLKMNTYSFGLNATYLWDNLYLKSNCSDIPPPSSSYNVFLKPTLGILYYAPFQNHQSCFGPTLEVSFSKFIAGISYLKGQNTIETLSLGTYTRIPAYTAIRLPISKSCYFIAGGGYAFNSNTLDPKIKSYLTSLGYPHSSEALSSSPFLLVGFGLTSSKHGEYRVSYCYDNSTAIASNDTGSIRAPISLHALWVSILF